ncbi:MAG TPA: ferritin-like domain-containing protein [Acetobacteraceae bacterium]|jgi:ferritin-like metal-binding protein YciE|nr:ferritin-like domain-containing protein [Acetobacteraceae bacterium]
MKTPNDLFLHFLQDVYYAETQITKALPKMVAAAKSDQLKQALQHHLKETEGHVSRLQTVFEMAGQPARGTTCEAINGIIQEGDEVSQSLPQGDVRDAGIIANAQAVEHYEMARYGTLIAWAKAMGKTDCASLLQQTLDEEKKADSTLSQLANSAVNQQAMRQAA